MPRKYVHTANGRRNIIDREKVMRLLNQGVEVCAIAERLGANRRHLNAIISEIRKAVNPSEG
jgi:site-specific recombinase XerC